MPQEKFDIKIDIQAQFSELNKQIESVRGNFLQLHSEIQDIEVSLDKINNKSLDKIYGDLSDMTSQIRLSTIETTTLADNLNDVAISAQAIDLKKSLGNKSVENINKAVEELKSNLNNLSANPININANVTGAGEGGGGSSGLNTAANLAQTTAIASIVGKFNKVNFAESLREGSLELGKIIEKLKKIDSEEAFDKLIKKSNKINQQFKELLKHGLKSDIITPELLSKSEKLINKFNKLQKLTSGIGKEFKIKIETDSIEDGIRKVKSKLSEFKNIFSQTLGDSEPLKRVFASLGKGITKFKNKAKKSIGDFSSSMGKHFDSARDKIAGLASNIPVVGDALSGLIKKLGPLEVGFVAVGIAAFKFNSAIEKQIPIVNDLINQSNKLGESANKIQKFQNALMLIGLDADTAREAMKNVAESVSDAVKEFGTGNTKVEALNQLGLDAKKLQQLKPTEQLLAVVKALDSVGNSSDRTRLALELGQEDLSRLTSTSGKYGDSLHELLAISEELTTQFTDKQLKAIRQLNIEQQKSVLINQSLSQDGLAQTVKTSSALAEAWNGLKKEFKDSRVFTILGDVLNVLKSGLILVIQSFKGLLRILDGVLMILEAINDELSYITLGVVDFTNAFKQLRGESGDYGDDIDGIADAFSNMSSSAISDFNNLNAKAKNTSKEITEAFEKGALEVQEIFKKNVLGEQIEGLGAEVKFDKGTLDRQGFLKELIPVAQEKLASMQKMFDVTYKNINKASQKLSLNPGDQESLEILDINAKRLKVLNDSMTSLKNKIAEAKQEADLFDKVSDATLKKYSMLRRNTKDVLGNLKLIASSVSETNIEAPLEAAGQALKKAQEDFGNGLVGKEAVDKAKELFDKINEFSKKTYEENKKQLEKNREDLKKVNEKILADKQKIDDVFKKLDEDDAKRKIDLLKEIAKIQEDLRKKGVEGVKKGSFEDFAESLVGNQARDAANKAVNAEEQLRLDKAEEEVNKLQDQMRENRKTGKDIVDSNKVLVETLKETSNAIRGNNTNTFITVSF